MREIPGYDKAMSYALYLLGVRMRTIQEMRTRLLRKGYGDDVTQQVLQRLNDYGYLDDSAYVSTFVKSRLRATGSRRLKYQLVQKGIAQEVVEEGLVANYPLDQEMHAAEELADKIWRQLTNNPPRNWQSLPAREIHLRKLRKTGDKLLSRGFSYNIVHETLQKLGSEVTDTHI